MMTTTSEMHEWIENSGWHAAMRQLGPAFAAVGDASRYAATHLDDTRLLPLLDAANQLLKACDTMQAACRDMPDVVSAAMVSGALAKVRRSLAMPGELLSVTDQDEFVQRADAFEAQLTAAADAWRRAQDEVLVAAGMPPIGEDI